MVCYLGYREELWAHECANPEGSQGWPVRYYHSRSFPQLSRKSLTLLISYLIRAEIIALHEGEVSYTVNPRRGAQFYPDCVQIEVTGDGTVELPEGVSFPGAYSHEDPGVVHNVSSPL